MFHKVYEVLVLHKLKIAIEADTAELSYQRCSWWVWDGVSNTQKAALGGCAEDFLNFSGDRTYLKIIPSEKNVQKILSSCSPSLVDC